MTDDHVHAALDRLQRGDIGGLAALVETYQVQAVRIAYLITQDRTLAEDVVQSAFVRVYEHVDQFDRRRPFAPWFFRIVTNAAIQSAQRSQRQPSLDEVETDDGDSLSIAELLPDSLPSPEDQAERSELRRTVQAALAELSPEQRAVVVQRYYFDMTDDELAEKAGIQTGTVRWRLHAARKRLRVLLRRFNDLAPNSWEG